jgi:hypothetical protein
MYEVVLRQPRQRHPCLEGLRETLLIRRALGACLQSCPHAFYPVAAQQPLNRVSSPMHPSTAAELHSSSTLSTSGCKHCTLTRSPDYQLTPSQWGAGGGSATHKEPTQAPSAYSTQNQASNMAATSPPALVPCQPMYVRQGQPISTCQRLTC